MKLHKLSCPNCNGTLDLKIDDKEYIFCPYCGQKFFVEDGKKEYTITQNININKNVTYTNRNIDDAEVIRAKTEAKEKMWFPIGLVLFLIFDLSILIFMGVAEDRAVQKAKDAGKISAGAAEDYLDEDYEVVVAQLETLGFTNITIIDLDDSGIKLWKADKVESVLIDGDTSFDSGDYFEPDVTIIIKYH